MTNVKFNNRPFEHTLNNLVDNFFSDLPVLFNNDFNEKGSKGFVPVNVKETEKAYELEVIAPGFEKEDFKISLDDKLLTVSAEKKGEVNTETGKQLRREYSYRSFKRTFTVDEMIEATNISASYINGVLILNLPKKEEVREAVKEIKIN